MNFAWKVFVENQACYDEYRQYGPIKGKNVSLVGYCKLDEYSKQKEIKLDRKRIILAPHHSIINDTKKYLYLSNFLEYADLFLNLPKKYPEIDFIFRPHPLLFERLSRDTFWGEEKTQAYFKELISNPNVIYSDGDFYYDIFMNSDAMIHDCGSFVAEYLVTGHPCCYMLRDYTQFTQFGIECLDYYYKAFNEKDILDFIDNVVIGGIDVQKGERECFVDKYIKINYPDVSGKIIKEIKDAIVANP
jgi:CDP-glycerol glycerophosphotransferase (TagB/SpsB family)